MSRDMVLEQPYVFRRCSSHGNSRERNGVAMSMMLTAQMARGARKLGRSATCLRRAATAPAVHSLRISFVVLFSFTYRE